MRGAAKPEMRNGATQVCDRFRRFGGVNCAMHGRRIVAIERMIQLEREHARVPLLGVVHLIVANGAHQCDVRYLNAFV